jgi:Lhr-like helicase
MKQVRGLALNKKVFMWIIAAVLITGAMYYKLTNHKVKINTNKITQITYVCETEKNKMSQFDVTNSISRNDISYIVKSLNNGELIPDIEEKGTYTLEHIEVFVLGDRDFQIYKQKDGSFTVMYTIRPGSNSPEDYKQTTIESDIINSYFNKFRELSGGLPPTLTWDINQK